MSESEALYPLSLRSGARQAMEAMDESKKSREEVIEPGVMETPPGDESAAQYPKRLRGDDSPAMDGNKKVGHPPLKLSYINVCRLRWKIMERRLPR